MGMPMTEQRRYSLNYMLKHFFAAGFTFDQVEEKLAGIPDTHPDKPWYIDQFLSVLPEDKRPDAEKRLRPTA